MGLLYRDDFNSEWQPSADIIKGPKNGFPRFDNVMRDEEGAITLRLGSRVLNPNQGGSPRPMSTPSSAVHSLFTTSLLGVRQRCCGVDDKVFINFNEIASGLDGTGDIKFASHAGHIFMTRGNIRRKWDGTRTDPASTRRWGIPNPTGRADLFPIDPDQKIFSTFNQGETPAWVAREGTIAFDVGQDGAAAGSIAATPVTGTGKSTIERVFSADENFELYDGGDTGIDEDLIEFYVWISQPDRLDYLVVSFDVGAGVATTARFQEDYYFRQFDLEDVSEVKLDNKDALTDKFEVERQEREEFRERLREGEKNFPRSARIRRDTPVAPNAGWNKFSVPRGTFERVGSTPGRNWSTVRAVQITAKYKLETGTGVGSFKFDNMVIRGGSRHSLTGKFAVKFVWVRRFPNYIAKSGPSPISDEIELRANGLQVTIPPSVVAAVDPQCREPGGEVWVYLAGGTLNGFYRFATAVVGADNSLSVTVTMSERDAIIENEFLEADITIPPVDIVSIVGPHYNRLLVFTETQFWPSLANNPDSFSLAQMAPLADQSERVWWATKLLGRILVGTSKDIYELDGTGKEFPDGSVDFRLRGLSVPPPISDAYAQEGSSLAYLASDGWQMFTGTTGRGLTGDLYLLYQGVARYGIPAPDLGAAPGRFRGAIVNDKLYSMTPEGFLTNASPVVHVHFFHTQRWRRYVYPRSFQVIYREPDGKLLAGDLSGMLWQIETPDLGDVVNPYTNPTSVLPVPVFMSSFSDDDDKPLQFKVPFDFKALINTLNMPGVFEFFLDEGQTVHQITVAQGNNLELQADISFIPDFKRIRWQFSGSFYQFFLRHWGVTYRTRPLPRMAWDGGFPHLGEEFIHIREIQALIRIESPAAFTLWLDRIPAFAHTIPVPLVGPLATSIPLPAPREVWYPIPIGRNLHGRVPRFQLRSQGQPFELYRLKVVYSLSGALSERRTIMLGSEVE